MARAIVALSLVTGACVSQQPPMLGRPVPMSTTLPTPPEPTTTSTTSPTYEQLVQLEPPQPQVAHTRTNTTRPPPVGDAERVLLDCISRYEGTYTTETGNGHHGRYQATQQTWDGVWRRHGRSDLVGLSASSATPPDQDRFAVLLLGERGLQPWPPGSRYCRAEFAAWEAA